MGIYLVSSEWRAIEGWYGQWMLWTVNGHGSILGLFMGYPCAHWNNIMGNFYELKQGVIPWSCSEGQPWSITGWLLPLAIVCLVMLVVARPSWFRRTYATCPVGETVKPEFVASKHHPLDIKCDVVVDVSLNLNKSIHKGNQIQHTHTKRSFLHHLECFFLFLWKAVVFFSFLFFVFRTLSSGWIHSQNVCSNVASKPERTNSVRKILLTSLVLLDIWVVNYIWWLVR